eukprot:810639-Prymnesium_polylepis.1
MNDLERENIKLKQQVQTLEASIRDMNEALRESTKLLLKVKPTRLSIPHERKLLQAASQKWKCSNPY